MSAATTAPAIVTPLTYGDAARLAARVTPVPEVGLQLARLLMAVDAAARNQALAQSGRDELLVALRETNELCLALATVALTDDVEDYLPFGLRESVSAWLRSPNPDAAIRTASRHLCNRPMSGGLCLENFGHDGACRAEVRR